MKRLIAFAFALLLVGCASTDYKQYADSQVAIQTAKSNAEEAKYRAMADIARSGDTTAKVAAMMALQGAGSPSQAAAIMAPKSTSDAVRDWVGILVPSLIQGYGIHANTQMGMTQSNNARDVAVSTNGAFVGIAGQIQAPAANVTTTSTDSHNTATDSHAITGSYNPATTDNSNQGNPATTQAAPLP